MTLKKPLHQIVGVDSTRLQIRKVFDLQLVLVMQTIFRLVTSFKWVVKDKELLFIAHKIVTVNYSRVKHSTRDTQGALQLQTFRNFLYQNHNG